MMGCCEKRNEFWLEFSNQLSNGKILKKTQYG
jgi:hypothetical protein